jgi:rare lipoprotein A
MKRIIALFITGFTLSSFCAAQTDAARYGIFRQEGIASWYGVEFAGRPTASGEIFNPAQFTAAHPTLPFGTVLKVTNTHNNRTVTVRVNDRGPFVSSRIIDVSQAAAEQLDIITTGTAPVLVESVTEIALPGPVSNLAPLPASSADADGTAIAAQDTSPQGAASQGWTATIPEPQVYSDSPPPMETETPSPRQTSESAPSAAPVSTPGETAPAQERPVVVFQPPSRTAAVSLPPAEILPALPSPDDGKNYRIQVGSYKVPRNAVSAFEKLKSVGLDPAYERSGEFYRVVIAKVPSSEVAAVAEKLGAAGFREALIRAED